MAISQPEVVTLKPTLKDCRLSSLITMSQSGGVFRAPMSFVQKYQSGLDLRANRGDGQVERPRQVFIDNGPRPWSRPEYGTAQRTTAPHAS